MDEIDFETLVRLLDYPDDTPIMIKVDDHDEFDLKESEWQILCETGFDGEIVVFDQEADWTAFDLGTWMIEMIEESVDPVFVVKSNGWEYEVKYIKFSDDVILYNEEY